MTLSNHTDNRDGAGVSAVSVVLPWPDKALSQNSRVHWSRRARATKAARAYTGWAIIEASCWTSKPKWRRAAVALTFCPPDKRRRDLQNCIGSAKALVDGIADAIGIDDSLFDCTYQFGEPVKGGAVLVTIKGR